MDRVSIMTSKDYVGKTCTHKDYGKVVVTGHPKKARTTVYIRVVQRKPGWHEPSETYRRVKKVRLNPDAGPGAKTLSWRVHNKDEHGIKDECHIDDLTIIQKS